MGLKLIPSVKTIIDKENVKEHDQAKLHRAELHVKIQAKVFNDRSS